MEFERATLRIVKADGSKTLENSEAWMKYWDTALEHDTDGTRLSLSILKVLSLKIYSNRTMCLYQ